MKKLLILLCITILLTGCSKKVESEEPNDIYGYLPIFADKSDAKVSGNMLNYTFIRLHCDSDGNWAYVQDFNDTEPTSPLYLYEFTNSITVETLLSEMPERSKDFEVDSSRTSEVDDFYDKIIQYSDSNWQVYEHGNFVFSYANVMEDDHYYNEKRIYRNGKPVCFIKELSEPYTVQNIDVTNDAYVWLGKD